MKRTAGVITELHDVIRKKIHEISNGDDAEAASMAKRWFDLVEDTNFDGINFNEDIYEKLVSSKSVSADMSYFTFRNHFLTKVIEPVRAAVLEFLTEKDSSLKRDRDELDWISGFLDNYVTIASTNRVVAELRKEYANNKAELNAAHKLVDKVFGMENKTMNRLSKELLRIAHMLRVGTDDPNEVAQLLKRRNLFPDLEVDEDSTWMTEPDHPERHAPGALKPMRPIMSPSYKKDSQHGNMWVDSWSPDSDEFGLKNAIRENIPTVPSGRAQKNGPRFQTFKRKPENVADVISDDSDIFNDLLSGIRVELEQLVSLAIELSNQSIPLFHLLSKAEDKFQGHTEELVAKWADSVQPMSVVEKAVKEDEFNRLYVMIEEYLAALRPYMDPKHSKVIIVLGSVLLRFNSIDSKAIPGGKQLLSGKLNWTEEDVHRGEGNQTDRAIYKRTSDHVLEVMNRKLVLLREVLQDIQDERVQNMKDLTQFKNYFRDVDFVFRDMVNQLVRVSADVVGRTSEENHFAIGHLPKKDTKEARVMRNADFSWRGLWDKVKSVFSDLYDKFKEGLSNVGKLFGIYKNRDERLLKLADKLNRALDVLMSDDL